jgi:hypothetical protein
MEFPVSIKNACRVWDLPNQGYSSKVESRRAPNDAFYFVAVFKFHGASRKRRLWKGVLGF